MPIKSRDDIVEMGTYKIMKLHNLFFIHALLMSDLTIS